MCRQKTESERLAEKLAELDPALREVKPLPVPDPDVRYYWREEADLYEAERRDEYWNNGN